AHRIKNSRSVGGPYKIGLGEGLVRGHECQLFAGYRYRPDLHRLLISVDECDVFSVWRPGGEEMAACRISGLSNLSRFAVLDRHNPDRRRTGKRLNHLVQRFRLVRDQLPVWRPGWMTSMIGQLPSCAAKRRDQPDAATPGRVISNELS